MYTQLASIVLIKALWVLLHKASYAEVATQHTVRSTNVEPDLVLLVLVTRRREFLKEICQCSYLRRER